MFQFGIFASHLPHLIIAAAYMIYFGACAFDGNEDAELELGFNEAVTNLSFEQVQINSSIGFHDVYVVASAGLGQHHQIDRHFLKTIEIFHCFEDPLHAQHVGSYLFSRPPPIC